VLYFTMATFNNPVIAWSTM